VPKFRGDGFAYSLEVRRRGGEEVRKFSGRAKALLFRV
jgi:hypothetical protein